LGSCRHEPDRLMERAGARSSSRLFTPFHAAPLHTGRRDLAPRRAAKRLRAFPALVAAGDGCLQRLRALAGDGARRAQHRAASTRRHSRQGAVGIGGASRGLVAGACAVAAVAGNGPVAGIGAVAGGGRGGPRRGRRRWRVVRPQRAAKGQQAQAGDAHGGESGPSQVLCRPLRGSRVVKVVPSPSLERASMVPPCASTIWRTMNSPSPRPPERASPRRPGSKT